MPHGALRIRDWYVEREAVVAETCRRLGVHDSAAGSDPCPRVVGLAGPGGAGKSTAASMVVARMDVRAYFRHGVLWLPVGPGAKARLPQLMLRLADMVYETVMLKACRPPRRVDIGTEPENGANYIREVVGGSHRCFLVVADDVWAVEVLEELGRSGASVIYTTRLTLNHSFLYLTSLRLDHVLKEEAEKVLRRAADLDDEAHLPDAAHELMERCEFVVMDLAFVGRWSFLRGRNDGKAWRKALDRILKVQQEGGGKRSLPWRACVLRVGLEELACDNPHNKELYLSLAVLPKGYSFCVEDAAVLLYGGDLSAEDLEATGGTLATLERLSILTREGSGKYRVHDDHTSFVRERFATNPETRDRALLRWRGHISALNTLLSRPVVELVNLWVTVELLECKGVEPRPYDAALGTMDRSSLDRPTALRTAGFFHWLRGEFAEAYNKTSELLVVQENAANRDPLKEAHTLHSLGCCALNAGRARQAEDLFRRAQAVVDEKLDPDHPHVARFLYCLGLCASAEGRTKEAEELLRRALSIREGKLGSDNPDVGRTLHALGACVSSAGRAEEAELLLRRALAVLEAKLGCCHVDVGRTLHELGVAAAKVNRPEQARESFKRALVIRRGVLGPCHPDVCSTETALGDPNIAEKPTTFSHAFDVPTSRMVSLTSPTSATIQGLPACLR